MLTLTPLLFRRVGCYLLSLWMLSGCGHILQNTHTFLPPTSNAQVHSKVALSHTAAVPSPAVAEHTVQKIWVDPLSISPEVQAISSMLTHTVTRGELLSWVVLFLIWRAIARRWHAHRLWQQIHLRLQRNSHSQLASHHQFHALLAHELRGDVTRLNSHITRLEALAVPPRVRVRVRYLHQGLQRMSILLNQLLSLSRIQLQPDDTLRVRHVSVQTVLRDVLEDLMPQIKLRKQEIEWIRGNDASIRIDDIDLRTLLRNLIENAIRYTPIEGRIEISLVQESDRVRIQVADSGPGIPHDQLDRVFEPFYRLQAQTEGSGLGLAIVKQLAARWQGNVTLCNRKGAGLMANVCLPNS
jgi:signal transduction histidine kinase